MNKRIVAVLAVIIVAVGIASYVLLQKLKSTETAPTYPAQTKEKVLILGDRVDISAEPFGFMGTMDIYSLYSINTDGSGKSKISDKVIYHPPWAIPAWSPDGKRILYTLASSEEKKFYVCVANPDGTGQLKIAAGIHYSWSPDGKKILYGDEEFLYIINADGTGGRTSLLDKAYYNIDSITWSPDGKRILVNNRYLINIDGTDKIEFLREVTLSPDWKKVCYVFALSYWLSLEVDYYVYVANANGTEEMEIAEGLGGGKSYEIVWSPDSTKILFYTGEFWYLLNADGSGKSKLDEQEAQKLKSLWKPSEKKSLEYQDGYIYRINADGTKTKLVEAENYFVLSPDEKRVAYIYKDESGEKWVYIINIDGTGKTKLTKGYYVFWPPQ